MLNLRFHAYVLTLLVCLTIVMPTSPTASAQPCALGWDPSVGIPGMSSSVTRALRVFDDGTGPALYAGGLWETADGVTVNGIAKWTGTSWAPVGGGVTDWHRVYALVVFDDGTGPALYASGSFTYAGGVPANRVAKWDGSSWSPLGGGVDVAFHSVIVFALAVYDDGTGEALYAAGRFMYADGNLVSNIARWDGASWSDVGGGMDGMVGIDRVNALAVYDDGTGAALYAGGMFTGAGGVEAPGIARWDGTSWSDIGGGLGGSAPYARALHVFDDGNGAALYAGGNFTTAGGIAANRVAKWDGTSWAPLGDGFGGPNPWVTSFTVFDDGTGPALYAGGKFTESGPVEVNRIAKWNGGSWEPLGEGTNNNIYALEVFEDGDGSYLYAGGLFHEAGGMTANRVARWGCSPAFLSCSVDAGTCVHPGEILTATLRMSKLGTFEAAEFEAYISFDDSSLSFVGGDYTPEPFGLPAIYPITANGSDIDLAAGIDAGSGQTPTSADADLVILTFQATADNCAAAVRFRLPPPETRLANLSQGEPPYGLVTLDSPEITIDGTPPTITHCPPTIEVDAPEGETIAFVDPGEATAEDNCGDVSVFGTRSDGLALTNPYPCPTTTIAWTTTDGCGHIDECAQEIIVSVPFNRDCNSNAVPDECELAGLVPFMSASEQLSPIGAGSPQSYVLESPPEAVDDVTLTFTAIADLGGETEWIDVDINGTPIGSLFVTNGRNCPNPSLDDQLVLSAAAYNAAVAGGDTTINMEGTDDVGATACAPPSYLTVTVDYVGLQVMDCNANGIPDECDLDCNRNEIPDDCDVSGGTSADCSSNGVPDECEPDCNSNGMADSCDVFSATSQDCNANNVPDECDLSTGSSTDVNTNGIPDECEADCNSNGVSDLRDIYAGTSADCQPNEVPDECDLAACPPEDLTCADCNGNQVPDGCEADCNTNGIPDKCDVPGDSDGDEDVDLTDYAYFVTCLTGPCAHPSCDPPLYGDPCCALTDTDDDGDVDLDDFAAFQEWCVGEWRMWGTTVGRS